MMIQAATVIQSNTVQYICEQCLQPFEAKPARPNAPHRYCSKPCMSKAYRLRNVGSGNGNFKGEKIGGGKKSCKGCGIEFSAYQPDRKFCSWECYQSSGAAAKNAAKAAGLSSGNCFSGKHGTDSNQPAIVHGLRDLGVSVFITADIGKGFPDLLCAYGGRNVLLEIKNPSTSYGKSGPNPRQRKWAADWQGEKPFIVYSLEDAVKAVFEKHGTTSDL